MTQPFIPSNVERFEKRQRPDVSPATQSGREGAPDGRPDADVEKLIDFQQLSDYAGFVLRAVWRHKWIATGTFLLTLGATVAAALLWPKTYHASAALLAQRTDTMVELSTGRGVSPQADGPARGAASTVLRHDNLIALIKQTNLVSEWDRTRAPILKAKDAAYKLFRRRDNTADEKFDALEGLLEQRIVVGVGTEGTVTFDVDWPEPRLAYEIAETALQNFLEARQVAETSAIAESISILERYVASLQTEVDAIFADAAPQSAKQSQVSRAKGAPVKPKSPAAALSLVAPATGNLAAPGSPELAFQVARLKAALDSKRQEIARLEDFRAQQLSTLQSQLVAARTIYTEGHPAVTSLADSIASASRESPQLVALKSEAQSLESQYVAAATTQQTEDFKASTLARLAAVQQAEKVDAARALEIANLPALPNPPAVLGAPGSEFGSNTVRLRLAIAQLGDIQDRLSGARIALATSQAGFKFRYSVIRPAQFPRSSVKPNVFAVLAAGAFGAILLAIASAVGADLRGGRIVEPWQMDRLVRAPVVARFTQL